MKDKSKTDLDAFDQKIRENRDDSIDKLTQQGRLQKSLEVEILERLITYVGMIQIIKYL